MRRKQTHYVVLGARDSANKAVIAYKTDNKGPGKYAVAITELNGEHNRGDTDFPFEDVDGIYTTLYFCKRESLDVLIKVLEKLRDMWREEDVEKS